MKVQVWIFTVFIGLLLVSCENKKEKEAKILFAEAQEMMSVENYEEALVLLDSLQQNYPKLTKIRRKAFELAKEARLAKGHRDSLYILPFLKNAELLADSLYQQFKLIEAPDMPEENILRYKGYDPSANPSIPFVDCYLTQDGSLKMIAGISASRPIGSYYVRFSNLSDGSFETSDTIPFDGGLNYRYEHLGRYYERLTFSPETTKRIAAFLFFVPENEQVRVRFYLEDHSGGPEFILKNTAREAIKETYTYHLLLQQILEIERELQIHESRLEQREGKRRN